MLGSFVRSFVYLVRAKAWWTMLKTASSQSFLSFPIIVFVVDVDVVFVLGRKVVAKFS